ncbi:MAG: response regulator [Spirochaetes bacterium]|nr:response regulator [Spirochaetota bacterium]
MNLLTRLFTACSADFNGNNDSFVHFEWTTGNISEQDFYAEISLCRAFLGRQEYILMVVTDISSLRQAENDKKEMQAHFFQMQKTEALGKLAAGVAHEFNNMLSIILGHAQLSLEEDSVDEIRNSLAKIEQVTKRGSEIVKKLSAYAKPREPFFVVGNITQVIDEVIKLQERQLYFENILIEKEFRNPSRVSFDYGLIEQVLLNLMINAAHAIRPKGKGKISIVARDEGNFVEIVCSDDGIGMDSEIQAKIFDPFFTTRTSGGDDSAERAGTGLGLSISHTIIKQHGGDIRVESSRGVGTTFVVSLPAAGKNPAEERSTWTPDSEDYIDRIKDLRILLVDDEEDVVSLMKSLFIRAGFENVYTAQSGMQALHSFENIKPDVIFLDIVMPDMSGYQVFEEIRSKDGRLPVVFTTGKIDINDDEMIKKQFGEKDFYHIIQKPFTMKDILSVLSSIVKNSVQKV